MSLFRNSRNDSDKGFRNPRTASTSRPRNPRNPRFAPEFLESRLSPSTIGFTTLSVEVRTYSTTSTQTEAPLPRDTQGNPIPEPTTDDGTGLPAPI